MSKNLRMTTASRQIVPLDSVDRRMLAVLQTDGRISNAALADQLHLSPSPCLRRMRALERSGVIAGYRAVLDREALMRTPEVVSAHVVSGTADILAEVVVPDLMAYERLLFDVLLEIPQVVDVRSNFAMRALKPSAPLPLPSPAR